MIPPLPSRPFRIQSGELAVRRVLRCGTLLRVFLLGATLLAAARSRGVDPATPAPGPQATIMTTPSGVRYGIWPAKPALPAPTLFIFASSIEETLNTVYFRQSGNLLAAKGYLCVSVDLPCHGREVRPGEAAGLVGWRRRCDAGENFVEDAVTRFRAVLDALVANGLTDANKVAACGTSRGGFMAMHFAARDPRVHCVAAFAPCTDLTILREFQGMEKRDLVDSLSMQNTAKRLAGHRLWIITGDRDERVGTDLTIAFARQVTAESLSAKLPALVDLHVMSEPRGHSVPPGVADQAAEWIHRNVEQAAGTQ